MIWSAAWQRKRERERERGEERKTCDHIPTYKREVTLSKDTGNTLAYFYLLIYTFLPLSPFYSHFSHLYHVFPIHSGCLTTTLLHQKQTATQSCSPAAYLHLFFFTPLFSNGSLELSVCCQQSRFYSVVSFSLLSPTHFSVLDVNAATDTLFSTLTSRLDHTGAAS